MLGFLMYPFMAKKNFLYPADWVKQEPYPTVNSTDIYYTGIANRVYDILKETKCDTFFTSIDQLRVVTMVPIALLVNVTCAYILLRKTMFNVS